MRQLNVRNVDDKLWREVRQQALESGISVGKQLNRILAWWQDQRNQVPPDAAERARRGMGIMADVDPGHSWTEELLALRREEFEREEREFEQHEREALKRQARS